MVLGFTVLINMPTHMLLYMDKLHRSISGFTCGILNLRNIVLEIHAVDGIGLNCYIFFTKIHTRNTVEFNHVVDWMCMLCFFQSPLASYAGWFMTYGHYCRRWFHRSLWSKKVVYVQFWIVTELWPPETLNRR